MLFAVELRRTKPECTAEYAYVEVEARDAREAEQIAPEAHVHGWRSAGDSEHWGEPAGIAVLAVAEATDEIRNLRRTMHFPVTHVVERVKPEPKAGPSTPERLTRRPARGDVAPS